jgi:hypothetical protein
LRFPTIRGPARSPTAPSSPACPIRMATIFLGDALVTSRDATGLRNPAVWGARTQGAIRSLPDCAVLTPLGVGYDTGLRDAILHVEGGH